MASGGQPIPPDDEELANAVDAVRAVPSADFETALHDRPGASGGTRPMHERYIAANLSCSIDPQRPRGAHRLHAAARHRPHTVGEVLPRAGFTCAGRAQMQPDGAFPEVKFRIPNPEVPESMELVTAEARRCGADAGFATDPDADRLGCRRADGWSMAAS